MAVAVFPVRLRAFATATTAETVHLAVGTGSRTLCGTGIAVGDAFESEAFSVRRRQKGRALLCSTCSGLAQRADREAARDVARRRPGEPPCYCPTQHPGACPRHSQEE